MWEKQSRDEHAAATSLTDVGVLVGLYGHPRCYVGLLGWLCLAQGNGSVHTSAGWTVSKLPHASCSCFCVTLLCCKQKLQDGFGKAWMPYNAANIHTLTYSRGIPTEQTRLFESRLQAKVGQIGFSPPFFSILLWTAQVIFPISVTLDTFTLQALLNLDLLPSTRSWTEVTQVKRFPHDSVNTEIQSSWIRIWVTFTLQALLSLYLLWRSRYKAEIIPPPPLDSMNTEFQSSHITFDSLRLCLHYKPDSD